MIRTRLKGEVVQLWLTRKNMSQNWLANKLNVSSGYMSQLLNGSRTPSPALRRRIQERLNDKVFDDLFEVLG